MVSEGTDELSRRRLFRAGTPARCVLPGELRDRRCQNELGGGTSTSGTIFLRRSIILKTSGLAQGLILIMFYLMIVISTPYTSCFTLLTYLLGDLRVVLRRPT